MTADEEKELKLAYELDKHLLDLREGISEAPMPKPFTVEAAGLKGVLEQLHLLSDYVGNLGETAQHFSDLPPDVPTAVGKFSIRNVLGKGGQASALLAFDPDLKRHVVLKLFHAASSPEDRERILREGQLLARVDSPFVSRCFGVDEHEGRPYLIMEYIAGQPMSEIHRRFAGDIQWSLNKVLQIARGLAVVHACGLIHRDVKPANVMITEDGCAKLVDLGMAAPLGSNSLEQISGTLAYMAPEQARGEFERIDQRTDIFGVGATLYELLTGRPPYQAGSSRELLALARKGEIQHVQELNAKLPKAVSQICMKCLASNPEQRPSNIREVDQSIKKVLTSRFKPTQLQLATVALLLVLGTFVVIFFPKGPDGENAATVADLASQTGVSWDSWGLQDLPKLHPVDQRELRRDFEVRISLLGASHKPDGLVQLVEGSSLKVKIQVEQKCFVQIISVQPDGDYLLFPNAAEPDSLLTPNVPRTIPGEPTVANAAQQEIIAERSQGSEYLLIVASTEPWIAEGGEQAGNYMAFHTEQTRGGWRNSLRGLVLKKSDQSAQTEGAVCEVIVPYQVVEAKQTSD